jgi:hypothetical protein
LVLDLYGNQEKRMRILPLVYFLMIALSTACAQSLESISSISFTKQSRGFIDEVVVSRDSVHGVMENHRDPDNSKHYAAEVDQDSWSKLMIALQEVDLPDIDGLQSPTMNRAHDGAVHSSIVITFEDGNSISHSFDDEKPHPDLQPLLDALLQFRMPDKPVK